MLTMLPPRSRP